MRLYIFSCLFLMQVLHIEGVTSNQPHDIDVDIQDLVACSEEDSTDSVQEALDLLQKKDSSSADKGVSGEQAMLSCVDIVHGPIPLEIGSVNVITGALVDHACHSVVSGPDPYVVAHSYTSTISVPGSLSMIWDLNHCSHLWVQCNEVDDAGRIIQRRRHHTSQRTTDHNKDYVLVFFKEPSGGVVFFEKIPKSAHYHHDVEDSGYSAVHSIRSPYTQGPDKMKVSCQHPDTWIVELGDGSKRIYAPVNNKLPFNDRNFAFGCYHITDELLASGNTRKYEYNGRNLLVKITTFASDGVAMHVVNFNYDEHHVIVSTSDGRTTSFEISQDKLQVSSICSPGALPSTFWYHKSKMNGRVIGNNRREEIDYYFLGKNKVNGRTVHVHKDMYLEDIVIENKSWRKVKQIKVQRSPGGKVEPLFSFFYNDFCTQVQDQSGCQWEFSIDKNRLKEMNVLNEAHKMVFAEEFTWNSQGRLTDRKIYSNALICVKEYEFLNGDVVKERVRGVYSGNKALPFKKDKTGKISGSETIEIAAQYDELHRQVALQDPLGNWTYITYVKDTTLIASQCICDQTSIVRRSFFTYDPSGICIEEIIDDGSSKDKNNLSGVTRRTIHRTSIRREMPNFGQPLEETWSVVTSSGEQCMQRIVYSLDGKGCVAQKEIFDGLQSECKVWKYTYDELLRPIQTIDPSGKSTSLQYDACGHVIKHIHGDSTIEYEYDLNDHVIREHTTFLDGSSSTKYTSYDALGRHVETIDGRGKRQVHIYDPLHRLSRVEEWGLADASIAAVTTYEYNGLTVKKTSPTGAVSTVVLSAWGKVLQETNPLGGITKYRYDKKNRLVEQISPSGCCTIYVYDSLDRVLQVTTQADGIETIVKKRYIGFDCVEEIFPTYSIEIAYDVFGQPISRTMKDRRNGEHVEETISYDGFGRVIKQCKDGRVEQFVYDVCDRVIEHTISMASGAVIQKKCFRYDMAGRLIEEGISRNEAIAWTKTVYGTYGRPISITQPDGSTTKIAYALLTKDAATLFKISTTDPLGVTRCEILDSSDHIIETTTIDPFGTIIAKNSSIFSANGLPTTTVETAYCQGKEPISITTRYVYDCVGNVVMYTLAENSPDQVSWKYTYDVENRPIVETKPSGVMLKTSYDGRGRIKNVCSSDTSISLNYVYDEEIGLPSEIVDTITQTSTKRIYNGFGSVVKEVLSNGLEMNYEFTKGLVSKIIYPDSSYTKYTYNSQQIASIQRGAYTYAVTKRDSSGVITKATLPGSCGSISRSLDCMGRLTSVYHPVFSERRTAFTAAGQCSERTICKEKEVFGYDLLYQLIDDNGRAFTYDSLYRHVSSEGIPVATNNRSQVIGYGADSYRYDVDGNRICDGIYTYTYDVLDRLVCVETAFSKVQYTYDPFHRCMSMMQWHRSDTGWQEQISERYFWHDNIEIGSVNNSGSITSLRVLGEGVGDIGSAVLCEVNGTPYVPIHDISGNLRVVLSIKGRCAERLSYTAFGIVAKAQIAPWSFSSKRQDPLSGLWYFGRRWYDQHTIAWMTQDPKGREDGPNMYAYVAHNPLMTNDPFGLAAEDSSCQGMKMLRGDYSRQSSLLISRDYAGLDCVYERCGRTGAWVYTRDGNFSGLDFSQRYANQSFGVAIGIIPGINTTNQEVDSLANKLFAARTEKGLSDKKMMIAVFSYSVFGLCDMLDAGLNVAGVQSLSYNFVDKQISDFFNECNENEISFSMDIFGHSNGGALLNNLIGFGRFEHLNGSAQISKNPQTLGASYCSSRTMNYIAERDPIPWIVQNAKHFKQLRHEKRLVFLPSYEGESWLSAHSIEGPAYFGVLRQAVCKPSSTFEGP